MVSIPMSTEPEGGCQVEHEWDVGGPVVLRSSNSTMRAWFPVKVDVNEAQALVFS